MTGSFFSVLLAAGMAVASAAPSPAQMPSVEPTPERHAAAVESARQMGMALFVQYYTAQEASGLIAAEYGEDPAVAGWLVDFRAEGPRVRFLGGEGDDVRALYQVDYLGREPRPPVRFDPPQPLEPGEDALWKAKRSALAEGSICPDVDYVAILAPLEMTERPGIEVYVLASSTLDRAHLGGHARVRVDYDGVSVQEVEPLSKSCLTIEPEPGQEPIFLAGSHVLSSTPIAPHVFLSMQVQKPLLVTTDAGAWLVLGNQIHYTGLADPVERNADAELRKMWIRAPSEGWEDEGAVGAPPPPWRERLIVWRASEDAATPWRDDDRFRGQFEPGYPDDLMVGFPPAPDDNRGEAMFVRVFAHHRESDRYLGMLLNQPRWLSGIFLGDNVEFAHEPEMGRPLARLSEGAYDALSVPPAARDGELAELYEGIRHYRSGMMGGERAAPQIDACVATLGRVVSDQAASLDAHHRYLAHYFLGRCLAESYETDRAIEQFGRALELQPNALDPNLALLAELLLETHEEPESESIEKRYLDQLAVVRERYGTHERVGQILGMLFDREYAGDLSQLSAAEIARRERVGFGAFRWKVP